jgi:hypothetical protein
MLIVNVLATSKASKELVVTQIKPFPSSLGAGPECQSALSFALSNGHQASVGDAPPVAFPSFLGWGEGLGEVRGDLKGWKLMVSNG